MSEPSAKAMEVARKVAPRCPTCHGEGTLQIKRDNPFGPENWSEETCDACRGQGLLAVADIARAICDETEACARAVERHAVDDTAYSYTRRAVAAELRSRWTPTRW